MTIKKAMKMITIIFALIMTSHNLFAQTVKPPFIGKRTYNLDGGSGTGSIITITKGNQVIIKGIPGPGTGGTGDIEFKGPYKPIIKTKEGRMYKIEADKISLVNAKGIVEKGCIDEDTPCTAKLEKL